MKRILTSILALSLSACSSIFDDVYATMNYALSSAEDVELTQQEIIDFPYTALYANWDETPRILIVLGYIEGSERHWITADRETLVTHTGRVVRTADLDYELIALSALDEDPLRCLLREGCSKRWVREGEFRGPDQNVFSRLIVSEFTAHGRESIELPYGTREVVRFTETGYFSMNESGLNKHIFTNEFWLEDDGHVVKSRQTLIPGRSGLTLTQVKWVGRND